MAEELDQRTMGSQELDPPSATWRQREDIVSGLEKAWQEGQTPNIEDFVPVSSVDRQSILIDLVRADLECRFSAGLMPRVEEYLEKFPELQSDSEAVIGLVELEWQQRCQRGESTPWEEFERRFPAYFATLGERLRQAQDAVPTNVVASDSSVNGIPDVPGYQILGILGRGGMGVVYQARQLRLARTVALKMIRGARSEDSPENARFRAEAEVVAQLRHPNIVQIHEIGEAGGMPFFSLEYVDGGSLHDYLKISPLPAFEAAHLVETLARAMHYAHQHGIIHRDLKPANILLARGHGRPNQADQTTLTTRFPKIADFGLAKRIDLDNGQTRSGAILGTPSYMPPEQALGKIKEIGPAADIYALGAILYDALVGRPPFRAATPMETVRQLLMEDPIPPRRLQPKVPRDLETICLKCLEKDQTKRYASAEDLGEDLRRFQAGEPILARPAGWSERSVKWARRRPFAAVAIGLLACLLVLGLFLANAEFQAAHGRLKLAEQELAELQRVEDQRAKAEGFLLAGADEIRNKNWSAAVVHLAQADTAIGQERALAGLKARTDSLLAEARHGVHLRQSRERFQQLGERAQLHSYLGLITGVDADLYVRSTRQTATEALQQAQTDKLLTNDTHFSPQEQADIKNGCYTIHLLLAEASSRPLAKEDADVQAAAALKVLDATKDLRVPTLVYHLRRAKYLSQAKDEIGAEREREAATALGRQPVDTADEFLMGDDSYQRRSPDQAIAYLTSAVAREPRHFWARFLLGLCRLQKNQPEIAKEVFSGCLSQDAGSVAAWLHLLRGFASSEVGNLHNELSKRSPTRGQRDELRKRAQVEFHAAEYDFAQADLLKADGAPYALALMRGTLRLRQGKHDEALADYQAAVRLKPEQFQGHLNLARAHEARQELDPALRALNEAVRLKSDLPAIYRTRAQLHLKHAARARGWSEADAACIGALAPAMVALHRASALRDLDTAIRHEGAGTRSLALADDHKERGLLLVEEGRFEDAVAAYDGSLQLQPAGILVHRLRAEALLRLARFEEALRSLDAYLSAVERTPEWHLRTGEPVVEAYQARGIVRTKLGRLALAREDFTHALSLKPSSTCHAERGWLYLLEAAPKLALADFDQAIELDAGNADAHNGRGLALVFQGKYQAAVEACETGLRLGLAEPRMLYNAARVFAQAAGRVDADPAQRNQAGAALRGQYQRRSLELLNKALAQVETPERRVQFWEQYIRADAALTPIKNSPGFLFLATKVANEKTLPGMSKQ